MEEQNFNWEQVVSYAIIALHNLKENRVEMSLENLVKELNALQTRYGKEGIIGIGKRYLNNEINSSYKNIY